MVSIIVPIYNAEKYISRCVESILAQSYHDFELILIDDGSTDFSLGLCKAFVQKDSRVRVIHQINQGVSSARNLGIKHAHGEYIGFVDIDDYIDKEMLKKMVSQIRNTEAEIIVCDSLAISAGKTVEIETISALTDSKILEKSSMQPEILLELAGAVWRCFYSTDLIRKNNIIFPMGLKISEDRIFNLYAMGYAKRIAYLKEALYYRTLNEESAVHRYHFNYMEIVERGRLETIAAIKKAWNDQEAIQDAYKRQYVEACVRAIENEKHKDSQNSYIQRYKKIRSISKTEELVEAIKVTEYYKTNYVCKWIIEQKFIMLSFCEQKFFRRIESINHQIEEIGIWGYFNKLLMRKIGKKL